MSLIELILGILKFANFLMGMIDREAMKKAGRDEVLAQIAQEIAVKSGVRKVILEKVDAMSEDEVDAELRDLEPPVPSAKRV